MYLFGDFVVGSSWWAVFRGSLVLERHENLRKFNNYISNLFVSDVFLLESPIT